MTYASPKSAGLGLKELRYSENPYYTTCNFFFLPGRKKNKINYCPLTRLNEMEYFILTSNSGKVSLEPM